MVQNSMLDLHTDPFTHGQVYTALSRVWCYQDNRVLFEIEEEEEEEEEERQKRR
jgi:hypothetical protein